MGDSFDIRLPSSPSVDSPQEDKPPPDKEPSRAIDTFHPVQKSTTNSKDSQNPNRVLHQTLRWIEKHYDVSVKVITKEKKVGETFFSHVLLHPIEAEEKLKKVIELKKH